MSQAAADTATTDATDATDTTTSASSKSKKMENLINDAIHIVNSFSSEPAMDLYFKHCHGIVLLSAYEASFLFSAQGGTGLLLRHEKKRHKWSPPCAIGLVGAGVGIQAGVEKKDVVMFLTEKSMVKTLAGEFQLRIGAQIGLTLGDEGEEDDFYAHFSTSGVASTSSFAKTRGAAIGLSFEGGMLAPRFRVNEEYYGEGRVSPKKILFGRVNVPESGTKLKELHDCLDGAMERKKVEKKLECKPHVNMIE